MTRRPPHPARRPGGRPPALTRRAAGWLRAAAPAATPAVPPSLLTPQEMEALMAVAAGQDPAHTWSH